MVLPCYMGVVVGVLEGKRWFMLRLLFDVDSSAPVNDCWSLSWVMFTLMTKCPAKLSVLFLPSRKTVVSELLRTGQCTSLLCVLQPRLDGRK